jgi:acyl dehydratase
MAENPLSIDGVKAKIGEEGEPLVYEIEKGMIQRFVQAIDDPNPLWQDEEYAQKSQYGGIIAPPTFIPIIGFEQIQQQVSQLIPHRTVLHAATELECYQPLRPGEVVTVTTKIANIRQRQGKMGKMAFITFENTYKNQRQELVARCRQMVISY